MKMLVVNRKMLLSILMMVVLIYVSQGVSYARVCQMGDVIAPGESCTYVAGEANVTFSVNADGQACRSGGPAFKNIFGVRVRVGHIDNFCRDDNIARDDTFNSNFSASKNADLSWTVNSVPAGAPVVKRDPVVKPDLIVQSFQVSKGTLMPGERFTLSATVKNNGDGRSPSTTLRYYRSTDDNISTSDTEVGSDSVSARPANTASSVSVNLTAPTLPGTYYYGVCVDSVTDESDTDNNCSVAASVIVTPAKEDVNGDGTVNIQDLVLIASRLGRTGENIADVNGDGVVNILDIVVVAGALGDATAAPSLYPDTLETLTMADVKLWLSQAHQRDVTDPSVRKGILFLEQLLASIVPRETALLANYPNPFNPETWIPYQLSQSADVMLTIYASNGQVVRRLALGYQPAGEYQSRSRATYWDGRNALGEPVASGLYFYTLSAGDFTATRKMLIRK